MPFPPVLRLPRRRLSAAMAAVLLAPALLVIRPVTVSADAPVPLTFVSTSSWLDTGRVTLLHVVGELRNDDTSGRSASDIVVDCKLQSQGVTVQEESAPADVSVLRPTERSPFDVFFVSPATHDAFACTTTSAASMLQPDHHFAAQITSVGPADPTTGDQPVSGTVTNLGTVPVAKAMLIVTYYANGTDNPLRTIADDTVLLNQGNALAPNTPTDFSFTRAGPAWDGVDAALLVEAPLPNAQISPPAPAPLTQLLTTSSPAQNLTLTNIGTGDLHVGTLTIDALPSDWTELDTCAGQTLVSLGTCSVSVVFTPQQTGPRNSTLTIHDDADPTTQVIPLTGTGTSPLAVLSPSPLPFNPELVGQTSAAQTLTIANPDPGVGDLHVQSVGLGGPNPGDFHLSGDTCSGATVAHTASCTVQLTFTAGGLGPRTATVTVTDDALSSPQHVTLTGSGIASSISFDAPAYLFANTTVGMTGSPVSVKVTNNGTSTLNVTSACLSDPADFAVGPGGCAPGFSLTPGTSTSIPVTFTPSSTGQKNTTLSLTDDAPGSPQSVTLSGTGTFGGQYHAVVPARLLDTRITPGALGSGQTLDLPVAGNGPVPATDVIAAVLNVTVTAPTQAGYLTVYPAGVTTPLASNLNFVAGQTVPNLVEVALGAGGAVTIFNSAGNTHVVVDVEGYVSAAAANPGVEGFFNPASPVRILDTRTANGGHQGPLPGQQTLTLQVAGRGPVPATGAEAVVLNVTETNPTAAGYLTVFPAGAALPLASNLNFVAGATGPNRVIVRLGAGGAVSIFNSGGNVDVVVDVAGWFTDATAGGSGSGFTGVTPTRILDTRNAGSGGKLPAGVTRTLSVAGVAVNGFVPVPALNSATPPTAVVLNVTVTNPTASGSFLTVWPAGFSFPLASDLNYVQGQTVPNLVVVQLGAHGSIDLFNSAGAVDVVVDVVGWYG